MKFFKILLCLSFIFVFSACGDKKDFYDQYSGGDGGDNTSSGDIGDKCRKDKDCKSGLVCINKVCSKPVSDEDLTEDSDTIPDGEEPADDTDSGKNDTDTGTDTDIPDSTDSGTNDGDGPKDDADSEPDEDQYVPECGNGIKDEGEECDNALDNSNEPGILGQTCRPNCTFATCGDGTADSGELCDDGNRTDGDYCRNDCQGITGYCGDGIEQWNEQCDTRNNPYCSEDCQTKLGECGDGTKQSFEVCDNADPSVGKHEGIGTYCSEDCKKKEHACGDGITQLDMEVCDDGADNGKYGKCNNKCDDYAPDCGDGILHRSNCNGYGSDCVVFAGANEACDDGNNEDGDYCSSDCKTSFGACGDGIIQEGLEVCDSAKPGVGNGEGTGAYCVDNCQTLLGECGDGIIQEGIEQCDNGQTGTIRNGNLDCEYGSYVPCERCTLDCKKVEGKIRFCGDGIKQPNEECDKATTGEGIGPFYCSDDCKKITGYCGDGIKQQNEECDPNKTDDPNTPYCSDKCKIEGRCGDKILNGNEECDNGETGTNPNGSTKCAYGETSCEVCTTECKKTAGITSYCGNGGVDEANGEKCDDRQNNGKYSPYATSAEAAYCDSNCKGRGEGGFCGDGKLQRANCSGFGDCTTAEGANESCDEGANNGNEYCPYNETSCEVCTSGCEKTAGSNVAYCGDGILQREDCTGFTDCVVVKNANEVCDDGNTADGDYCSANCQESFGSCGDGTKQDFEICDKAEPNVGNKQGIGAYCSDNCKTKLGECGDGITMENIEDCDDGANNGHYKHDAPGFCNGDCRGKGEGGYCGDETKQPEEECDNGGNTQPYCPYGQTNCKICTSDCTLEDGIKSYCNDGIIQREDCTGYANCVVVEGANETCDDGANNGKYGGYCNSSCSGSAPHCNDGIIQRADCTGYANCVVVEGANETCDDGGNNGQYSQNAPGFCNYGCNGRGEAGYCGDGTKQDGEECDDGGNNGKYGFCDSTCSGNSPKCGDGIIQREDCTGYDENCVEVAGTNEACDEGSYNSEYNHCNSDCSAQLTCGDGILQRENCDGYGENCVVTEGANEACDDGSDNGGYEKCNNTCSGHNEGAYCGDGILQRADCTGYDNCVVVEGANEMCDSGTNNGKYSAEAPGYCNTNCDGFAEGGTCNDGTIQREDCTGYGENCVVAEGANETCDEGQYNGQYDHCNSTCSGTSHCGDGIQQPGESCDDGFDNGRYGNYCNETCNGYTGYCNDGIIQRTDCTGYDNCIVTLYADEECDDNVLYNGTYGHCNDECSAYRTERCGDGIIQRENCDNYTNCQVVPGAFENCDDGAENGQFGKCDEKCKETITWKCGDGNIDFSHGEVCDEGEDVNGTYQMSAPGSCDSDCLGRGKGGYCGDGIQQPEESCDDGADNNTPGFCNEICNGQTPLCGNGIIEGAEACDNGEDNGKYGKCKTDCSGLGEHCGDGKIQKASETECGSIPRCDGNTIQNCCEVAEFAEGYSPEICDEGGKDNGYHGHCNETCDGISYCGDGVVGKDEVCEQNGSIDFTLYCFMISKFTGYSPIRSCNDECMPIFTDCSNNTSFTSPFLDTKQTLCYNNNSIIPCQDESGDFYGQGNNFSYETQNYDVGNDVITETFSNSVWQKATPASYENCENESSCNFEEAQNYCKNLNLGGQTGWRLPSAFELPQIADFTTASHIYSGFTNTNGNYWTAEGGIFATSDGTLTQGYSGTAQVKCVISDNKNTSCLTCGNNKPNVLDYPNVLVIIFGETAFSFWYFEDLTHTVSWQQALAACKGVDINGVNKMRLPTANELIYLIDPTTGKSLIPEFTGKAWTSTTLNSDATKAYAFDFLRGDLSTATKTNTSDNIVICVE